MMLNALVKTRTRFLSTTFVQDVMFFLICRPNVLAILRPDRLFLCKTYAGDPSMSSLPIGISQSSTPSKQIPTDFSQNRHFMQLSHKFIFFLQPPYRFLAHPYSPNINKKSATTERFLCGAKRLSISSKSIGRRGSGATFSPERSDSKKTFPWSRLIERFWCRTKQTEPCEFITNLYNFHLHHTRQSASSRNYACFLLEAPY